MRWWLLKSYKDSYERDEIEVVDAFKYNGEASNAATSLGPLKNVKDILSFSGLFTSRVTFLPSFLTFFHWFKCLTKWKQIFE